MQRKITIMLICIVSFIATFAYTKDSRATSETNTEWKNDFKLHNQLPSTVITVYKTDTIAVPEKVIEHHHYHVKRDTMNVYPYPVLQFTPIETPITGVTVE
jgi:hypothetical protein